MRFLGADSQKPAACCPASSKCRFVRLCQGRAGPTRSCRWCRAVSKEGAAALGRQETGGAAERLTLPCVSDGLPGPVSCSAGLVSAGGPFLRRALSDLLLVCHAAQSVESSRVSGPGCVVTPVPSRTVTALPATAREGAVHALFWQNGGASRWGPTETRRGETDGIHKD